MKNVIILSNPRSGTTLMVDYFINHKKYKFYTFGDNNINEPINPKFRVKFKLYESTHSVEDCMKFHLDINESKYKETDYKNIFKILHYQLSIEDLINILKKFKENSKFIVINRSNKLDEYISRELGMKNQQWVNHNYTKKIQIIMEDYIKYANKSIKNIKELIDVSDSLGLEYFKINYDNSFSDDDMERLFKFLGYEYNKSDIKIRLRKQRTNQDSEYIENHGLLQKIQPIIWKV